MLVAVSDISAWILEFYVSVSSFILSVYFFATVVLSLLQGYQPAYTYLNVHIYDLLSWKIYLPNSYFISIYLYVKDLTEFKVDKNVFIRIYSRQYNTYNLKHDYLVLICFCYKVDNTVYKMVYVILCIVDLCTRIRVGNKFSMNFKFANSCQI